MAKRHRVLVSDKISQRALETLKKEKDRTYSSDDWFEWSEGRLSLGKKSAKSESSRDIHSYGISVGADKIKKDDRDTMYGYVFQYGNDNIEIGSNGTGVDTDSYSFALYGTKIRDNQYFTDGVIGVSLLHIDHLRVINDNALRGDREGQQIYGSINFGKRLVDEEINYNPGIKLDLGYTKLKAFREKTTIGNSLSDSLIYKEQNIKTALATIGLLFDTANQQEEKTTNHHGRLEYVGDFSPTSNTEFYYVNNQSTNYEYKAKNKSKNYTKLKDNTFDIVHSSATIEHVGSEYNQNQFIKECLRISKKTVIISYKFFQH